MFRIKTVLAVVLPTLLAALPFVWQSDEADAGAKKLPTVSAASIAAARKALAAAKEDVPKAKTLLDKAKAAFEAKEAEFQKARNEVDNLQREVANTKNPVTKKAKQAALDAARKAFEIADRAIAPLRTAFDQARQEFERKEQLVRTVQRQLDDLLAAAISRTVSEASRAALRAKADAYHVAHLKEYAAEREAMLKRLQADLKQEQTAFENALRKQPGYDNFSKELAAIETKGKSLTGKAVIQRASSLSALQEKFDKMFDKAYQTAGIDEAKLIATVQRHLGKNAKQHGHGIFVVTSKSESALSPPPTTNPVEVLRAPFDDAKTEMLAMLIAFNQASAEKQSGNVTVKSWAAGYLVGTANGQVRSYVSLCPGHSRVKITANLQRRYSLDAHALPGLALAGCHLNISLTGMDDRKTQGQSTEVGSVLAFLNGHKIQGDGKHVMQATFPISASGGEYLLDIGGSTTAFGMGIATAAGANHLTINDIRIELIP